MGTSSFIASVPALLWRFYVESLWRWRDHPSSWVSHIASLCRILAILLIIPVLVLILLDIASYGIARTLGVIDLTDASTSDKKTIHAIASKRHSRVVVPTITAVPSVHVSSASPDSASASFPSLHPISIPPTTQNGNSSSSGDHSDSTATTTPNTSPLESTRPRGLNVEHPDAYFTSEENSLKLSGVGLFSPAASRPPSPTITRRALPPEDSSNKPLVDVSEEDEGIVLRRRPTRKPQNTDDR
uniref:Proteophosphoglycan ppg4 n=1 Tax=Mycena chlorophos TaxID=658473 RepID=A0ABQ0L0G2_MYCCL|nr:predicted protein [Mycena chlorophos]